MNSQASVICVLGMHRSGTSCLAGSLQRHGVRFGDVQTANRHNLKGNRESVAVNGLNEAVLIGSGGSWRNPPETIRWTAEQAGTRDAIIAAARAGAPGAWGFKDPRCVFTLPFWRDAVPQLRAVASFRHPFAVARSLAARNGFSLEAGLALWTRYNRRLIAHLNDDAFPVLCFDLPDAEYRAALAAVCAALGFAQPVNADEFFDASLRHQQPEAADTGPALPDDTLALYEALWQRHLETVRRFGRADTAAG